MKVITVIGLALGLALSACKSAPDKTAELAARGRVVYRQYKTADYATAKAALLDDISLQDRTAAEDPKYFNMCNEDAVLSYLRLAKLEEKNNGPDGARYMAEAISRCQKGPIPNKGNSCSAEALRAMVDKVDTIPPR